MDERVVITLFRHGLTEGNKRKAYMGWNDSPLSEEARSTLSMYSLNQEAYDAFISSDLKRCMDTMRMLFPHVEPALLSQFREMNFGAFQGKTYDELVDNQDYQSWVNGFFSSSPPEGESFDEFSNRIQEGWKKIVNLVLQDNVRHPFIVTHGGVIRYLLTQFAPDKKDFWDWKISHGTGIEMVFQIEQLRRGERCILLQEVPLTGRELG